VGAGGGDALVLEVDLGRRAEELLEAAGAVQRGAAPLAVDVADRLRNLNPAVGGDLLLDDGHREDGGEVLRADRLHRAGVDHRRERHGQVGRDVVPRGRDLGFGEQVFDVVHESVGTGRAAGGVSGARGKGLEAGKQSAPQATGKAFFVEGRVAGDGECGVRAANPRRAFPDWDCPAPGPAVSWPLFCPLS
jgi:hypothetical protein